MNDTQAVSVVAVTALVTAMLRFLPFLIFTGERKSPEIMEKLGRILPSAIMGMLVIYCLKGISFVSLDGYIPHLISGMSVVVLHLWKRNTLLSIMGGTILYMFLVQQVF